MTITADIGGREDPVRLVLDATPGSAIVRGRADLGDRFRLVGIEVSAVPPVAPLPEPPVAQKAREPAPSLATSAQCWLAAGGPHHTGLFAVGAGEITDLAEILGPELVSLDAATTPRAFAKELRWNQDYYRIAAGL